MTTLVQQPALEFLPTGVMDPVNNSTGGSTSSGTYRGANLSVVTNATIHKDYAFRSALPWEGLTVSCDNMGHLDVVDFPLIRRAGGFVGVKDVRIGNTSGKVNYRLDFSDFEGATAKEISSVIADSYYDYSASAVLDLLESAGTKQAYVNGLRNADSWWPQLTGIPYSNSVGGGRRNNPLVTPRHLLGVWHYPLYIGSTVTFKTATNESVTRSVVGVQRGPNGFDDLNIYLLNADLPGSIHPLPVVGSWISYISASGNSFDYAHQQVGIFLDQNREAGFLDVGYYETAESRKPTGTFGAVDLATQFPNTMHFAAAISAQMLPSLDPYRASHKTCGEPGDSGSAALVPVAGGWAIASVMTSPWGGGFPQEELLNAMIAAADAAAGVSTGHTVTVATDPTA